MKQIAIDASMVNQEKGGTAVYILNILRRFAHIRKDEPVPFQILLICQSKARMYFEHFSSPDIHLFPWAPKNKFLRLIFEQIVLPIVLFVKKISILHSLNYSAPLVLSKIRSIQSRHDYGSFPRTSSHPVSTFLFFIRQKSDAQSRPHYYRLQKYEERIL